MSTKKLLAISLPVVLIAVIGFKFVMPAEAVKQPAKQIVKSRQVKANIKKSKPKVLAKKVTAPAVQEVRVTYTNDYDLTPENIKVKVGQPVHMVIDVQDTAHGCMSTLYIPGIFENIQRLVAGQNLTLDFTPKNKGTYLIACAMNVPHGRLIVE